MPIWSHSSFHGNEIFTRDKAYKSMKKNTFLHNGTFHMDIFYLKWQTFSNLTEKLQ